MSDSDFSEDEYIPKAKVRAAAFVEERSIVASEGVE